MIAMPVSPIQASSHLLSYSDFQKLQQPIAPHSVAYGQDPLQHAELWRPAGEGHFPVVLMIHGGCWQTKVAKADIMHRMADALVRHGVAVWNIEYRGADTSGGGYPGTFQDVAGAADLLRDRGPQLGLDTGRIIAVGHSAGGHLALWLAARHRIGRSSVLWTEHPLRIMGVVSQGGLPDLREARTEAAHACGADTIDRLVGQPSSSRPDPYADTSPVSLAPLGIAQVMISGAADRIAPPRFAEAYAAKVAARGDAPTVITIPDQGHFELITPGTPAGDAVIEETLRLLDKAGRGIAESLTTKGT